MNNNDYILARWRDAITDPPPDCWMGSIRVCGKERPLSAYVNGWFTSYSAEGNLLERARTGDQWLDVTDRPGVPREAVQAAVDEIKRESDRYREKFNEINADRVTPEDVAAGPRNLYRGTWVGADGALEIIMDHTGVTPKEVTNG